MRRTPLFFAFLLACILALSAPAALAQIPIDAALYDRSRPMEHRIRDEARGVRLILELADAKPGHRVLDMGSGGGYLALPLSTLAGEHGHVDVHNTPGWLAQFPYLEPDMLQPRLARANLGFIVAEWDAIPGEPGSYDLIVMGQVYHDAVLEAADIPKMTARMFDLLKPGGRVVIEDHDADPAMPLGRQVGLHRIARSAVTAHFTEAGFTLVTLRELPSGHDDYRFNVFRPGLRGRTDRFIAVFEKPETGALAEPAAANR